MEWTYHITKPFSIRQHSLFDALPPHRQPGAGMTMGAQQAELAFSPGEIDEVLYCCLAKGYPDCVERVPKNELVAAVWRARGLA